MISLKKSKKQILLICLFCNFQDSTTKIYGIKTYRPTTKKTSTKAASNSSEDYANSIIAALINKKALFRQAFPSLANKLFMPKLKLTSREIPEEISRYYNFFKIEKLPDCNKIDTFNPAVATTGTLLAVLARDLVYADEQKIFSNLREMFEIFQTPASFPKSSFFTAYLPSAFYSTGQCRLLLKLILQRALLINSYNLITSNLLLEDKTEKLLTPRQPSLNYKNYLDRLKLLMQLQMLRLHIPPSSLNNVTTELRKEIKKNTEMSIRDMPATTLIPALIDSLSDNTASLLAMQINASLSNIDTLFFQNSTQNQATPFSITPQTDDCLNFMLSAIWSGHTITVQREDKSIIGSCALSLPYEKLISEFWNNSESLIPLNSFISIKLALESLIKRFAEIPLNTEEELAEPSLSIKAVLSSLAKIKSKCLELKDPLGLKDSLESKNFDIEVPDAELPESNNKNIEQNS